MGGWIMVYKRWMAGGAAVLLVFGFFIGYQRWESGRGSAPEWQAVNREMNALLASASPDGTPRTGGASAPSAADAVPRAKEAAGGNPSSSTSGAPAPGDLPAPAAVSAPTGAHMSAGELSNAGGLKLDGGYGPAGGHTTSAVPSAQPRGVQPVNINTAAVPGLMELPGIGESKAKAIVAYRESRAPFRSREDLMKVKGIGPKTFEALKDRITVSEPR